MSVSTKYSDTYTFLRSVHFPFVFLPPNDENIFILK